MTFDESNSKITEQLCGRTIDRVERQGKDLVFVTTCGHEIRLASDVNHDIHYKGTSVKIILNATPMQNIQGMF
jgi:formamidopyrimidine-DNA glycosylase